MLTNRAVDSFVIAADTVNNDIGLCYYDPVVEELLEFSADNLSNNLISLREGESKIFKYYLVVNTGVTPMYAKVRVYSDTADGFYSIKTIISANKPTFSDYVAIPDFNSFRVENPTPGEFIPVWLLVKSTVPSTEVKQVNVELKYE